MAWDRGTRTTHSREGAGASDPEHVEAADPYAAARRQLRARLAREQSDRPDLPQLDELVAEIADLQPLPAVAERILGLPDDHRFSAHELATVIASDQVMTARLLRLANSAYYGSARDIGSVRDAVVLLGFRTVRQVALAACMLDNPRPLTNVNYHDFWQFSVATGLLSELLARSERRHEDVAFTAGVVHNIGLLALDTERPAVVTEVRSRARSQQESRHDAERALLGFTDAELGSALALHWNFPTELADSIADQARTLDDPPPTDSLGATVMRARLFARTYGLPDGLEAPEEEPVADFESLRDPLERAGGMDRILQRVDAFIEAARAG